MYLGVLSCCSWSLGPSMAKYLVLWMVPEPIMAATDGPPCPQVAPSIFQFSTFLENCSLLQGVDSK